MYGASERFNEIILGNSRQFKAKIKAGEKEISTGFRSVRQYAQSGDTGYVSIGGAVSSYIEVEMWKPEMMLENAEIEVSIGLLVDGEPEYVPLGLYTVLKPQNDDGVIRFTAYDRIQSKMSGAYFSELSYPADGKDLLKEISTKTGVAINVSNLPDGVKIANRAVISETGVDENGDVTTNTTYEAPFNGYTYREALGYIAQLYGKFATADRTGTIVFRWYEETEYEINPNRYYDDLVTGESVFKVEAITCQVGDQFLKAGTGVENIQFENPVMTQERLDAVYELVKDLEFLPASLSFFGDMRIDLGDIVTVNDKRGNVVKVPVMNISQDFDGGLLTCIQSYSAIGQDESVKGPTVQRLDRMYTELFLVKEIVGQKASFDYVHAIDADFQNVRADYGEYKKLVTGKLNVTDATIGNLSAKQANFEQTTTERLLAQDAKIENLEANQITTEYLDTHYLNAEQASLKYATVESLNATDAAVGNLTAEQAAFETSTTERLTAQDAEIEDLKANQIIVDYLDAHYLNADTADLRYVTAEKLNATNAEIEALKASQITTDYLEANYATVKDLNATNATVGNLSATQAAFETVTAENFAAQTATINDLKAAMITADYLVANYAQIDLANIKDGSITDAKIVGLTANKITAGRLDAAEIEVVNLNAANITVGTINGQQIAPGAIDRSKLADGLSSTITNTAKDVKQALEDAGLAQSTATAAQGAASAASTAAGKAQSAADAASEAASKAQTTAESAQSTANAAKTAASTAQTTADGKNTVFYQTTAPATTGRKTNDVWFDTDDANRMYYFDGKAWTAKQFGTNAIANAAITNALIADAAINNAKIANLDAGKITTGTLAAARIGANTITAEKIALGDFTNYAQLNDDTAAGYGFSKTTDVNGTWYTMTTIARDKFISDYHTCNGGETFRIKYQISTSVKGNSSSGGTDSAYRGTAIGLYGRNATGTSVGIVYATRVTATSEATVTDVSSVVTLPAGARKFQVFVQTESYGNFSGTLKVRNVQVTRMSSSELIVDGAITAGKIAAGAVNADKLAANAVTAGKIATNAVTAGTIAAGAVNADKLAANAVTAGKIAANAVTTATIAAGAVNADKIASNAVTADKVNSGAITTDKLAAGAVTAAKMAAKTITANSGVIANAAITTAMIADLAVTVAKIADATITNAKIANATIEGAKIKDSAITNAKIADATIESGKIKSLDAGKITTGTLAADRIGSKSIIAEKLNVSTLSAITANLGTVTAGVIQSPNFQMSNYGMDESGNATGTVVSGCQIDLTNKQFRTPQITIKDDYIRINGYMTVGLRKSGSKVGSYSFAAGLNVEASGLWSYAEGDETSASSRGSHAEGQESAASGDYSHAEGFSARALGHFSHAEGQASSAFGIGSHAEGLLTIAGSKYQHVSGKYNISDNADKYAYIIGGGTSDSLRKNIFTVDWTGNVAASGTISEAEVLLSNKYAAKSHGNHVPAMQAANDATFLRNDNTWQKVTPANIGAASTAELAAVKGSVDTLNTNMGITEQTVTPTNGWASHSAIKCIRTGNMVSIQILEPISGGSAFSKAFTIPQSIKQNTGWYDIVIGDAVIQVHGNDVLLSKDCPACVVCFPDGY